MFFCINYFISNDNIILGNSILFNYLNESSIQIVSTFEKKSNYNNVLISEYIMWLDKYILEYDFNLTNFAFINYNNYFSRVKLAKIIINYYDEIKQNIPKIYNYYYPINQLFNNTYGFNNIISIKTMKSFLELNIKEYYVKNIETNYLLYIFIRIIKDYGTRFNSFSPIRII